MRINGHGHLLPEPRQIPRFMKQKEVFWLSDDKSLMLQKGWSRPIDHPSFFVEAKIEWMEKHGIDHEVVITLSQLYANGYEASLCKDIIRFQNDFHIETQNNYPSQFTTGFVVQPRYVDDALKEIERCVKAGLKVLCLPTHYQDENNQWKTVANQETKAIFSLANELNLAIEIHPYDAPKMISLKNEFWRFHLVWMCAQTADCHHFYSLFNFPQLFPNARVCFAHGNQVGMINYGRRLQGYDGRPDLFESAVDPRTSSFRKNIFVDTLVHDPYSLRLVIDRVSCSQIVAGLDDPYPLGEMDSVPGSYPGKSLDEAESLGFLSERDKQAIWGKNVLDWVYGKDHSSFKRRTGYAV